MQFEEKLKKIIINYNSLIEKVSQNINMEEYIKISKECSMLEPLVIKINKYNQILAEVEKLNNILTQDDYDLRIIAQEEINSLEQQIPILLNDIKISLLPIDEDDSRNAIIEIRAGAGGGEAALFAMELFLMYQRYVEFKKWKFEILSISDTGIGGYKEASALISGNGIFARLKFEAGVHRVQRIPITESNGRIHTSTATVAVLPEAEEIDITLDEKELNIETCRASGAGGQHVNTTDSAVRIIHIPTGITVTQQDERSQHKNKAKALKILRARLYEMKKNKTAKERGANRKQQVGSGDRSERIRTYNFPQGRVTEHRINLTLYKINNIIYEGQLDEIIDALITSDIATRVAENIE